MKNPIPAKTLDFVRKIRLGFVATVTPDGKPSLSHKGTLTSWDDHHLIFADIASPQTVKNLTHDSSVVVEVVDQFGRKGYRFKGTARVIACDDNAAEYISFYENWGLEFVKDRVKNFVLIEIASVDLVLSPAYAWGSTESELRDHWKSYFYNLWKF